MSCLLLDPPPSPPLAGDSVAEFRASLPGDLSGILIEPLAESTQGVGGIETGVTAAVVPVPPSCCSGDSDVPLAVLAKDAIRVDKDATHEGEGLPPPLEQRSTGVLQANTPRFRKRVARDAGSEGSKSKRGELFSLLRFLYCVVGLFM